MNRFFSWAAIIVASVLFVYGCGTFVSLEPDVTAWLPLNRIGMLFMSTVLSLAGIAAREAFHDLP